MKQNRLNTLSRVSLAAGLACLALSACGPQPFVPAAKVDGQAAGYMNIPPRVDIVLGMGMSGTMRNIFPGIQTEIPAFAKALENSGWDYRFVTLPMHETTPGSTFVLDHNVSGSQYHTNYVPFGTWKSPYPGATNTDPGLSMLSSLFSSAFIFPSTVNAPNDGHENGLEDIAQFVSRSDVNTGAANTGVLRPDALLAVIVLSNDDDKSGGTWRCMWDPNTGTYPSTCPDFRKEWVAPAADNLPTFRNALVSAKGGNPALVRYYALVAPATVYCRGYGARYGERYGVKFVNLMGGKYVDVCANGLSASLAQVSQDLVVQKLNYRRRYLVLNTRPNIGTIKIVKHTAGGDVNLAQGTDWQWVEDAAHPQPRTVYTIDQPIPMAQATGYVIELMGNGMLIGDETATVSYMNDGTPTAH